MTNTAGAGVISPTIGADCAAQLKFDYAKVYSCAFEGQYPAPYGLVEYDMGDMGDWHSGSL